MNLCLIEDDLLLGRALAATLGDAGYRVTWLRTVEAAGRWLDAEPFDAVVIDLGLPDGDGIDVLKALRRRACVLPALIVTARDTLQVRIDGLDAGADDFLVKPFATEELLARLRAVLRRASRRGAGDPDGLGLLTVGDLSLDEARRTCTRAGQTVNLSPTEYSLLQQLMLHKNRVRTRRQLELDAMPESQGQSLDVHMSNLRRKIGSDMIRTVRGVGYLIEAPGTP